MFYISKKFHETICNGFKDIERTRFRNRPMDEQIDVQELLYLSSVRRLMML